jgi:hypothetical protein
MFEIFRDPDGSWCARRMDGLVGGVFRDRAGAERFARSEDETLPLLSDGPSTGKPALPLPEQRRA